MESTRYSSHIIIRLKFLEIVCRKCSNIKFHEYPPSGGPSCSIRTDRWADKHDEANGRLSEFFELV